MSRKKYKKKKTEPKPETSVSLLATANCLGLSMSILKTEFGFNRLNLQRYMQEFVYGCNHYDTEQAVRVLKTLETDGISVKIEKGNIVTMSGSKYTKEDVKEAVMLGMNKNDAAQMCGLKKPTDAFTKLYSECAEELSSAEVADVVEKITTECETDIKEITGDDSFTLSEPRQTYKDKVEIFVKCADIVTEFSKELNDKAMYVPDEHINIVIDALEAFRESRR